MSSNGVFAVGKYKGRNYEEVVSLDPKYCQWAASLETPGGGMQDFVSFLLSRGFSSSAGGGPAAVASSAASGGLRLSSGTILVCELVAGGRKFVVRCERATVLPGRGGERSKQAECPGRVWRAVGELPGARLSSDRVRWVFPVERYKQTLQQLEVFGDVEPVPAWVLSSMERASKQERAGEPDPKLLPKGLLPYQLEGVRFGFRRGGRILFGDEMGLGKTLQALALAAQYPDDWPVLVVCPASVLWVWKDQVQEWISNLVEPEDVQVIRKGKDVMLARAKFFVVSYALFAKGEFSKRPDGAPFAIVIADESHNIKSWQAARTKALVAAMQQAKRVFLLSGTPTRNSADELHPQLCGVFRPIPANLRDFRSRYCLEQSTTFYNGCVANKVVGTRNGSELHTFLTGTVMIRRLKKDVLAQLPPKRRQRIHIEVSNSAVLRETRGKMAALNDMLAGNASAEVANSVASLFYQTAMAKLPATKEYISDVLDRGDEKMVIFAYHHEVLDQLSEVLKSGLERSGREHIRIDGRTPAAKRPELIKRFLEEDSVRVALLGITTCGEGISLTAAGLVIFAELYWVPGAVEQAEARAHRLGTSHSRVLVEFLVVPNSPDEIIYSRLEQKKKDTSLILDGAAESLDAVDKKQVRPSKKKRTEAASAGLASPSSSRKRAAVSGGDDLSGSPDGTPPEAEPKAANERRPAPAAQAKIDFLLRAATAAQNMRIKRLPPDVNPPADSLP